MLDLFGSHFSDPHSLGTPFDAHKSWKAHTVHLPFL